VTITVDPASTICTISRGVVTFTNPLTLPIQGACVLDAEQAGNGTWAPAQAQQTIPYAAPTITISPGTLIASQNNFNSYTFAGSGIFTATNTGSGPLYVPSLSLSPAGMWWSLSPDGCSGTTLAPGASCTFVVFQGLLACQGDPSHPDFAVPVSSVLVFSEYQGAAFALLDLSPFC
jgi:hypothetical protein